LGINIQNSLYHISFRGQQTLQGKVRSQGIGAGEQSGQQCSALFCSCLEDGPGRGLCHLQFFVIQPGIGNVRDQRGIALFTQPVQHIGQCRSGKPLHLFQHGRVYHRRNERAGTFQGRPAVRTIGIVQRPQHRTHGFLLVQANQQGKGKATGLGIITGFDQGLECFGGFPGIGGCNPLQEGQEIESRGIGHNVKGSHGPATGKGLEGQGTLLLIAGLGQAHQHFFCQRGSQLAQTGDGLGP